MKFYVVFKTINLVNGKMFYGMHSTDDLFYGTEYYTDPYIGLSAALLQDFKKYGRNMFEVYAIHAFTTEKLAEDYLEKLLLQMVPHVYESELYYNKKFEGVNPGGYNLSEETKLKMSIAKTGIPRPEDVKQRISETKSGTIWINDGKIDKTHIPGEPVPEGWKLGRVFRKRKSKSKSVIVDEKG
jgi:hypothetical protein